MTMKTFARILFFALLLTVLTTVAGLALADTLRLPDGLKTIEAEAFMGDTSLDEVMLPEGIESIGEKAFANSSLTRINLPSSLKSLSDNAFSNSSVNQIEAGWKTQGAKWAISHAVKLVTPVKYGTSFTPVATVQSAVGGQEGNETDVTSYLGKCFTVQDVVGGGFRFTAPNSGSYTFSVSATNISEPFYIRVYVIRDGTQTLLKRWRFEETTDIVTYTVSGIIEGETVIWWDGKTSNTNYTFLDPFQIMVAPASKISSTSPDPQLDPIWEEPVIRNIYPDTNGFFLTIEFAAYDDATAYDVYFTDIVTNEVVTMGVNAEDYSGMEILDPRAMIGVMLNDNTTYAITVQPIVNGALMPFVSNPVYYTTDFGGGNTDPEILPQPQNVVAARLSETSFSISWDYVDEAEYYYVYYSTSSDVSTATVLTYVDGNQNTYTQVGMTAGETYYLWVKACRDGDSFGEMISSVLDDNVLAVVHLYENTDKLTITSQPISQTVFDGESVTMRVEASGGTGSYSYQWYRTTSANTNTTQVSTSQNYTFTASSSDDGYYYYCVVTSGSEIMISLRAKLTVMDELTITDHPTSQSVLNGDTVTLSVTAIGGTGSYTYQWYRATNSTATGSKVSTSQNYTFTATSAYDGNYYYCVVTSGSESKTSNRARLTTIYELSIITHPTAQTVSDGESVTMSVTAFGGTDSYTYQWYRASSTTATGSKVSTSQNYTFTATSAYDGNYYYCVVTSGSESKTSDRAKLTVIDDATLPAPSNVRIDAVTNSAVSVSFSSVSGASGYYLYYSTSSTFNPSGNKVTADTSSCTGYVDGLTSGRTYYFWVAAYNANDTVGNESSRVSTVTGSVALTLKNRDTNTSYTNKQIYDHNLNDALYLAWTATNGNGTIEVKSFVMSRETQFNSTDANYAIDYLYGNSTSSVTFTASSLSTWDGAIPYGLSDYSNGQYLKIWVGARDKNYDTNGVVVGVQFALKIIDTSYSNDITNALLAKIPVAYKPGKYFTVDGKSCSNHTINAGGHCLGSNKASGETLERRVKLNDGTYLDTWGYQCVAYVRMCQYLLYGSHERQDGAQLYASFSKTYVKDQKWSTYSTDSKMKELFQRIGVGAHIRVYNSKNQSGTEGGHSLIITAISDTGVTILEDNYSTTCQADRKDLTWSQFRSRYSYGLCYYIVHN